MKKFSRFILSGTLLLMVFFVSSCAQRIVQGSAVNPAIISIDSTSQKFNLQLDFMKSHFSGLLIARRMAPDEIRLLFTTYFGLSVFDLSLRDDSLLLNSCIEPMHKRKIWQLLEKDFRIMFLPTYQTMRFKEKTTTFEERIDGKGFGKVIIRLSEYQNGKPQQVQIKHPRIRLKIQLDKLTTHNPQ